jgi:hypothetical protein
MFCMEESSMTEIEQIVSYTGVAPLQIRTIIEIVPAHLHRKAYFDTMQSTSAIMECYFNFGPQAAFHLAGLLEIDRQAIAGSSRHDSPISETMLRFDSKGWHRFCEDTIQLWAEEADLQRKNA